jgi:molybdopterin-guanine dinucleotide biosynthesis protein A
MDPRIDLTLAILAGGKGERLGGVAKGLLVHQGLTFIEHLLSLETLCREALIVSGDPSYDRFGARRVEDLDPGHGAPGGVVTALLCARTPQVLVVACDMPFVTREAARKLIAAVGPADVTCHARAGQLEPMLAVYRASLGPRWRARLPEHPSLRALIAAQTVSILTADDDRVLDSINTHDQLAAVKS